MAVFPKSSVFTGAQFRVDILPGMRSRLAPQMADFHHAVAIAKDVAIYDFAVRPAGPTRVDLTRLVWFRLPTPAGDGHRRQGFADGHPVTACLVGPSVGLANPSTGRLEHYALGVRLHPTKL